ncbi:trypsin-like serine peptidase [Sulfitobacter mediterraneus]|nr:trypsin-like peptidase domain-containing protein [Sulfitobacter mediterraneus]
MLDYHPTSIFAQVGQPVGRLRTLTSFGRSGCTAFLISPTHLMTNEHCIGDRHWDHKTKTWLPRTVQSVKVEMGAVDPNDNQRIDTYSVQMPPLEMNEALDYAILNVTGNPADKYGYLAISTAKPAFKMPLWIIGHPKLKVQQISRLHCRVIQHARPHKHRLHHTCPTAGGNSGSPVFDASTHEVIAINHARYSAEVRDVGLAVPFHIIAAQSPLLRAIIGNQ